jgi:tetratricopeptide (TPR) repeat protein
LELDENNADAHSYYAHLLSNTGRHAEALAEAKRARELEPLNSRINAFEGLVLIFAGQVDAGIDRLQKTLELDPNHSGGRNILAAGYIEKKSFLKPPLKREKQLIFRRTLRTPCHCSLMPSQKEASQQTDEPWLRT